MKPAHSQQGSLLIVAVVMIVVIGFLGGAVSFLVVSQVSSGVDQARSDEANYIAESGLERGIRQWSLSPSAYVGEGPVAFGRGSFTIALSANDVLGNPLPANQRRITSSASVPSQGGNAVSTMETVAQINSASFTDPFPNISGWPSVGPSGDPFNRACPPTADNITAPANTGWVTYDPTENAPGSTGGALRAEVNTTVANGRLSGYRQRNLAAPYVAGSNLALDFWYMKIRDKGKTDTMMMALDLVATDNTVYRLWSDCQIKKINWTNVNLNWSIPAGKTLDRVRLSFDVKNDNKVKKNEAYAVLFDHIILTGPGGGGISIVSWEDVIP